MRARPARWLVLSLSLLLAFPSEGRAQALPYGNPGQEGTAVPAPRMSELTLGSRFTPLQGPVGIPSLSFRLAPWAGGALGFRYSGSGAYLGNPHELEFSLKQRLLSTERGAPVSASLLGAVNTGAYSLDGELALSRELGPLTLLGTARLLGNADGARLPLGGFGAGARLGIRPQVTLLGDVFQVVNEADALPAWTAGVHLQLPATPYAVTLHVANTASPTRQGSSLGTSALRFGVDLGMALPGWPSGREIPARTANAVEAPRAERSAERVEPAPFDPPPAKTHQTVTPAGAPSVPPPTPKAEAKKAEPGAERAAPRPSATKAPAPVRPARPKPKPSSKPARLSKPAAEAVRKPVAPPKPVPGPEGGHESELWIVLIRNGMPSPATVQLRRGSAVTWFNRDASAHAWVAAGWDSGEIKPGGQFTRRFEVPGTLRYRCRLHPGEGGSITVR